MNEQELLKKLAGLPREIRPVNDPWPQISARIERSGPAFRSPGWMLRAVAASVVLLLAVGVLLRPAWNTGPAAPVEPVAESPGAGVPAPPGMLVSVDAEYLAAFREFVGIGGANDTLTSQTVEKIEMGWADLQLAEAALAAALEENPGDLFLNERMLELRARQLGFLKQLVALDRNNRRMTI